MYYIGFLKKDARHAMVFKSIVKPKRDDLTYFVHVMGPYATERSARSRVNLIKRYGYRENPVGEKIDKAVSYVKRGIRAYDAFKGNPATSERQRRFMCAELGRKRAGKKTRTGMKEGQLRDFCKKNPAQVISHAQALKLTKKILGYAKKLYRHEQAGVKGNPGAGYHDRKFLMYMRDLEKYKIGSEPYIATLAKAYEHLESAKDSMKEHVR